MLRVFVSQREWSSALSRTLPFYLPLPPSISLSLSPSFLPSLSLSPSISLPPSPPSHYLPVSHSLTLSLYLTVSHLSLLLSLYFLSLSPSLSLLLVLFSAFSVAPHRPPALPFPVITDSCCRVATPTALPRAVSERGSEGRV